ncbi:MAG: hypothetical protein JXR81_00375 [Candidatus Goldbacteria bacterium]|nr:hypothetical protein [Candidatus Goldiibacteriota bacterium]
MKRILIFVLLLANNQWIYATPDAINYEEVQILGYDDTNYYYILNYHHAQASHYAKSYTGVKFVCRSFDNEIVFTKNIYMKTSERDINTGKITEEVVPADIFNIGIFLKEQHIKQFRLPNVKEVKYDADGFYYGDENDKRYYARNKFLINKLNYEITFPKSKLIEMVHEGWDEKNKKTIALIKIVNNDYQGSSVVREIVFIKQ